jgi:Ca2+/Na+ antiporter
MTTQLAALYDISLRIHQIAGLALILIAVLITIFSVLSRNQDGMLEKGLAAAKLAGPFFGLVILTGAYQLIDLEIKFFQSWVIGATLLGLAFMGVLHGTWRPRAEEIIEGKVEGDALKKAQATLIGVAASMIIMIIVATYLMESQTG